ncbi:hypothetical protein [Kribbella shirazensis]|jgi:DNA-binding NarL/FixJ family response regulator|uniref:DNA-binding NarL/FixJ family response regulator n=1 Tax=Kribbella shirazensis TaxID=1105143 RepID=A0A7X5VCD4_9ACTN|nr:hypothetical protein [Kribbella shirazensis]NIK58573.1 DNA-binding NarL/FixJ family response regulator [Kribbella shirazensis]
MSVISSSEASWTRGDQLVLERCVSAGLPTVVIALKLGRCVETVRVKAAETGIQLNPSQDE